MRVLIGHLVALVLLVLMALPAMAQEGEGEVVRLYVGPEKIDCVGVAPQKCLLVTTDPTEPAEAFYDPIEGFEHEDGTAYVIDVLVEPVEDPPADGSSLKYTLVGVIEEIPGGDWSDFETHTEPAAVEGGADGDVAVVSDDEWCALFHRGAGDCVGSLPLTTGMGGMVPESWAAVLGVENDPSLEGPSVIPDADFCSLLTGELDACLSVLAAADGPLYLPAVQAEYTLADFLPPAE